MTFEKYTSSLIFTGVKVIFIILILFSLIPLLAQDRKLDSLRLALQLHPQEDTIKAQLTFEVATSTFRYNQAKSESLFIEAFEMADKLGWKRGKVMPLVWRGWHYDDMGMPGEAMDDYLASLKIADEVKDPLLMAYARIVLGSGYPDSVQRKIYILDAIKYAIAAKDTNEILRAYSNLSAYYLQSKNWNEFDKVNAQSLKLAKESHNKSMEISTYVMIATKLETTGYLRESIPYYELQISSARDAIAQGFVGSRGILSHLCARLSILFTKLNELDSAFYWAKESERSMADSPMSRGPIYDAYFNYYKASGDFGNALKYRLLYDSVEQAHTNFEAGKKYQVALARSELENKDALAKAQLQKQKTTVHYTIAGVILFSIFLAYAFIIYKRKQKDEKKQALASERLRISRELHDDIGSTLGSIALYSDIAKKRSAKDDISGEALGNIGKSSRELIEKMGDIIWNLNPENEIFEQLLNRMHAFSSLKLTPREINVEFISDDNLKSMVLPTEQRKFLFLIFKESINSIIKHAEVKNVWISMRKADNNTLNVRIKDDGKSFELIKTSDHLFQMGRNELKSKTDLEKALLADFNIVNDEKEGTSVDFSINILSA